MIASPTPGATHACRRSVACQSSAADPAADRQQRLHDVSWYGHLKYKASPLWIVIAASWLIALPEHLLQVPANRWGHAVYSAAQLKTLQEVITLSVFAAFSVWYLGESLQWNLAVGFALIGLGAWVVFLR
jgi:uncharacterized protein (DUF486 family)